MPRYMLEVPAVHESITRPIVRKITKEVLENFGLVDKNVAFVFNGMNDSVSTNNSTIGTSESAIRLDSDSRIEVDFEEELVNPLEVAILRPEQRFVFLDADLRVWLKPVYVSTELTISFKLITSDKTTATMWKRRAELQAYRGMHQFLTDIDYHYNIPRGFVKQLWVIHALRERSHAPLMENFGKWLKRCFVKNFTSISNQAYKNTSFAIAEKQTRIQGWFTFGHEVSQIERKTDAGAWETEFSVKVYYDRADGIVMTYPLMVHNQLMPPDFREDNPQGRGPTDYLSSRALSIQDMGLFERIGLGDPISRYASGVAIPYFDDWAHVYQLPSHACMTRILLSLVDTDPHWLFTFDHETLGAYRVTDPVLAYMKDCKNMLLTPFDSLFHTSVHEWYDLLNYQDFNIDDNLKLTSNKDLDFKNMYHIVICLLCDLSLLSEKGKEILYKHPKVFEDWVAVIWPGVDPGSIPKNPDGTINGDGVDDLMKDMVDNNELKQYNGNYHRPLVNSFSVFAYRK